MDENKNHLQEVVELRVDADKVDGADVEAVEHVQADLVKSAATFRHWEPVLVMSEISKNGLLNESRI